VHSITKIRFGTCNYLQVEACTIGREGNASTRVGPCLTTLVIAVTSTLRSRSSRTQKRGLTRAAIGCEVIYLPTCHYLQLLLNPPTWSMNLLYKDMPLANLRADLRRQLRI
jgi:hypothetical protein